MNLSQNQKGKSPADTQESLVLRRCPRKQLQTNMVRVYLQISSLFNLYHHINSFQLAQPVIKISTINMDIPWSQCMVAWLGVPFGILFVAHLFPITQFSSLHICVMIKLRLVAPPYKFEWTNSTNYFKLKEYKCQLG